jgi:hypothetical protein
MKRVVATSALLLALAGCTVTEKAPLQPLPAEGQPVAYEDLYRRARRQAEIANEAFMDNRWADLEDTARGLEQTARYLTKATDVPATHKDALPVMVADLGKEAKKLGESAVARNEKEATATMQRIILKVRELSPSKKKD